MGRQDNDDADPDTDVRSLQDKEYMGAWDIPSGRDVIATIVRVTKPREITGEGNKKNSKPVLFIEEFPKGIVLNATNLKTIGGMYGFKVRDWIGKRVTLYVGKTSFGSRHDIDCIRVRQQVPTETRQSAPRTAPRARPALNAQPIDVTADDEREAIEAES